MLEHSRHPFALTSQVLAQHCSGRVLCLSSRAIGRSFTLQAERPSGHEVRLSEPRSGDRGSVQSSERVAAVAVVTISGPLEQRASSHMCGWSDGYDAIAERVSEALQDPNVDAVVLDIDSPGGVLAGLGEAVRRMRAAADATGKDVIAFANEEIFSAAYWIAAGVAQEIYLPPQGYVGSIGCRSGHYSEAGALEKAGIAPTLFEWPPGKTAFASEKPLTDLGKERGNRDTKAAAEAFFAVVSANRGLTTEALMALGADMLQGQAAVDAGLADGVASLEDVVQLALSRAMAARLKADASKARSRR